MNQVGCEWGLAWVDEREAIEKMLIFPFDQTRYVSEFLQANFVKEPWQETIVELKRAGVSHILPASENGFRNVAIEQFTKAGKFLSIGIKGNGVELGYEQYKRNRGSRRVDPIEYQQMVARSKLMRVRNEPEFTEVIPEGTINIAFDTVGWIWGGGEYLKRGKPKSREELEPAIDAILSGEPFLVCTYALVQNALNTAQYGGVATIIPTRILTENRFARRQLRDDWLELYERIRDGRETKWKMTPMGPSLMHPRIQDHVEIAWDESGQGNLLPRDFSTRVYIERKQGEYRDAGYQEVGDLAYHHYARELSERVGFRRIGKLGVSERQIAGMVFAGYSDVGLKEAIEQFVQVKSRYRGYTPLTKLRDTKLMKAMSDTF